MTATAIAARKKKPAASRAARHTKQYMRKGVDVSNYEAVLNKANDPKDKQPVEEMFVVDREPTTPGDMKKYTKRQQAKMDKITKLKANCDEDESDSLPAPKAPSRQGLKRLRQPQPRPVEVVPKRANTGGTYDLWETDFTPKVDLENKAAGEHILRATKKKLPQKPSRLRSKPSLLRAVALPAPGVSYNPTAEDYQEYVGKIAAEEQELIDAKERLAQQLKPKHEKIVTEQERELEQMEGLSIDPRFEKDEEETAEVAGEAVTSTTAAASSERKTKKERVKEAKLKKEERQKLKKKAQKLNENEIFKAKAINKKLAKAEIDQAKAAVDRQLKKHSEKMTKRQKLGRGKFEEEEAPFLLQEELTDSLRGLKAQGNLLTDRIKSMQKRNMLPIGGERQKAKKTKLRKKFVEKRTVQEVKKGSRII